MILCGLACRFVCLSVALFEFSPVQSGGTNCTRFASLCQIKPQARPGWKCRGLFCVWMVFDVYDDLLSGIFAISNCFG